MKHVLLILSCAILLHGTGCSQAPAQNENPSDNGKHVGSPCEGCEAIYECPTPFLQLRAVDTLPDFGEAGPKLMITGIVYHIDGRTPAKDVVIYIYHTDQTGHYSIKGGEIGWGRRHGYIRGWVKTDKEGRYMFYTLRPAAYPGRRDPQHIHVTVKEPDKNEYWIDEFVFADDPLLQQSSQRMEQRGGSGIVQVVNKNGIGVAVRHIILGLNIPNYPVKAQSKKLKSGLSIGANCPAFDPLHLSGFDIGKRACPMCKYGYGQGVMVWFNHANLEQMTRFIQKLEQAMINEGEKKLRVFLVYMNPMYKGMSTEEAVILQRKIKDWCADQNLQRVAMVWVSSPVDESCREYQINPEVKNTVFVYKKRKVAAKWINMEYTEEAAQSILNQL
ncbi:MAG: intradiol ring-cleavage dioxygenase [Flavisolibacter sp.]|nr:intradiol ring-cleavage dioxygenase [Flavisolibacter sp.]